MAYSYIVLEEAQLEFEAIVLYLLELGDGPSAATDFIDEFDRQMDLICQNPNLYSLSRFLWLANRGYHMMQINNYGALYRVRDEVISVEHFFHQSQSYEHFKID